jgi:hypothetical protein
MGGLEVGDASASVQWNADKLLNLQSLTGLVKSDFDSRSIAFALIAMDPPEMS